MVNLSHLRLTLFVGLLSCITSSMYSFGSGIPAVTCTENKFTLLTDCQYLTNTSVFVILFILSSYINCQWQGPDGFIRIMLEHILKSNLNKIHNYSALMMLTKADRGSSSMHLQRPDSGHQHDHVRSQARVAALDVEELLHANVSTKASFSHWG